MKKCPKCNKTKDLDMFYSDKNKKDGKFGLCIDCYSLLKKEYDQTPKGRFTIIKKGAKRRGHSFGITMDYFMTFWNKDCSYCGDEIEGIGLDRIKNSIGYEEGNLVSCCTMCNMMKLTNSADYFISHCNKISKFQKE